MYFRNMLESRDYLQHLHHSPVKFAVKNNPASECSDKQLVNRVLAGDHAAFSRIISNTEALVAQICCKMISNPEDRKDIAQDVYLKIYRGMAGFKFQARLSTWIAQVAYNACFDQLRKKKFVLPGDLDADQAGATALYDPTLELIQQREMATLLRRVIATLPPVYRTLITLYHQEEMSYDEIGQITGLPEGTVKSYLFRARKALKDKITLTRKRIDL